MAILDKYKTSDYLGKYADIENRNPTEISTGSKGVYNIDQYVYPEDLSTKPDLQHYVAFYINVREKTKFAPEQKVDVDVNAGKNIVDPTDQTQAAAIGGGLSVGLAAASATSRALGGVDVAKIASALKNAGSIRSRAGILAAAGLPALVGGAAGAATYYAINKITNMGTIVKIDTPRRIQDAILLHVEKPPSVKYSMKYTDLDLGILAGLAGGSSAIETQFSTRATEAGIGAGLALASLPKAAIAAKILGQASPMQLIGSAAKIATNPFTAVTFETINQRTFNFSYTFLPRSEKEVTQVKNIIDLFKFHMHPELSSGSMFYIYPSEFDIVYYYKGKENEFVNKISTCALTDMDVKYGGEYFSTFVNGAPAEISMTLSFKELELLTKERIVKGY